MAANAGVLTTTCLFLCIILCITSITIKTVSHTKMDDEMMRGSEIGEGDGSDGKGVEAEIFFISSDPIY